MSATGGEPSAAGATIPTMDPHTLDVLEKILARWCVEVGDCVLWAGSAHVQHGTRYPRTQIAGKFMYIRRAVWERARGPIPRGQCVIPTCGNDLCVKLEHLALSRERGGGTTKYPHRDPAPPAPPHICPECGQAFEAMKPCQVYCPACKPVVARRADMLRKRRERGGLKRDRTKVALPAAGD